MPASMMSAPVGGSENVSGNSRLIVASGPRPGSTPTNIPMTQPAAQSTMFCTVNAWLKPNTRLSTTSMRGVSVERELDAENLLHREGDQAEDDNDGSGTRYREVVAGERRDRRHHRDPH